MEIATVTSKGQVTVPRRIREYLGIDTGSKLIFLEMEDGSVRLVNADLDQAARDRLILPKAEAAEIPKQKRSKKVIPPEETEKKATLEEEQRLAQEAEQKKAAARKRNHLNSYLL